MATRRRAFILAATTAAFLPSLTHATAKSYTGPNGGSWTTGTWSPVGVPSSATADNASIILAPTAAYTVNFNGNYTSYLGTVSLASTNAFPLTFNQNFPGDNMFAISEFVGTGGNATYAQSAATNTLTNGLILGYNAANTGTYLLSGAGTLNAPTLYVGYSGVGTLLQTGGSVTSDFVYLGTQANSTGSYTLSGGTLTTNLNLLLGNAANATGSLTINNGAAIATIGGSLTLGATGGAGTGILSLSNGFLTVANTLKIYDNANSAVNLSGGSLTVASLDTTNNPARFHWTGGILNLTAATLLHVDSTGPFGNSLNITPTQTLLAYQLSVGQSSTGSLNQTGGNVYLSYPDLGGFGLEVGGLSNTTGTYTLSGGVLNVSSHISLATAPNSSGTFTQSGNSTNTVAQTLFVGNNNASTAFYSLAGGTLSTLNTTVGRGRGSFSQSGGTHSTTQLQIADFPGSAGSYSLSGTGSLSSSSFEEIGIDGPGTFSQTSGSNATPNLYLGFYADSSGSSYNLAGGTLSTTNITISYAAGTQAAFLQSGGTNTISAQLLLHSGAFYQLSGGILNVPSFAIPLGASFYQTGGTLQNNASLSSVDNAGSLYYAGGTFYASLLNEPTGSLTLAANLYAGGDVTNNGSIAVPLGLYLASGSSLLNNGTLTLDAANLSPASFSNAGFLTGSGSITANNPMTNSGQITLAGGNLAVNAFANPFTNLGAIDLAPGLQLTLTNYPLVNHGTINLNAGTLSNVALTNAADGTLVGPGTLAFSNTFNNAGTLTIPDGTTRLSALYNTGLVELAGPAANLASASTLFNYATIEGHGKISASLANSGTIEATGGTLTLAGTVSLFPTSLLVASAGNKLLLQSVPQTNNGTISLTGGTLDTSAQPLTSAGTITGFGTLRTSSLTNQGQIQLSAGPSFFYGSLTSTNASKITIAGNSTATFFSPVTLVAGSEFHVAQGSTAVFFAPLTGQSNFTGSGVKDFESGASSPSFLATDTGSTTVQPSASLTTSYLHESSLTAAGPVTLTPNSPASTLDTLTITTGSLDLTNDDLTIASISPTTLRTYLLTQQLFSTTASADPEHRLALGYSDAAPTLITLTYFGDANLDGKIDADDYALLDRGYAKHLTTWQQGDFNYDGTINSQDYLLIDRLFTQQGAPLSPALLAERESQFGERYVTTLLASIPEPALPLFSLLCPLSSLLSRRRRPIASIV